MIPHFLDNGPTDGGQVAKFKRRLLFTPRMIHGTHFCYEAEYIPESSAAGRIRYIEKTRTNSMV
jgi:hypothetical protein